MGTKGSLNQLMNESVNDGGVCRAAPGFARGLLNKFSESQCSPIKNTEAHEEPDQGKGHVGS